MNERDVRKYINRNQPVEKQQPLMKYSPPSQPSAGKRESSFQNFSASHLFCGQCREATPVKERILLYLPDGDLYEFKCTRCGSSVGTKKAGKD